MEESELTEYTARLFDTDFLFKLFEKGIDINRGFKNIMEDYLERTSTERPVLE